MEIIIDNFKGIQHAEYQFEKGLTCLSGDSGKGKTTIFEAVKFVLYNLRTGYAPKDENSKTKVQLKYKNFTITREKKPDLLTVAHSDGKIYSGNEADFKVTELFGNQTIFELGSYISQGNAHAFVDYSAKESMDVISKLALGSEFDIDSKRNLVELKIREVENLYHNSKTEYEYLNKGLNDFGDIEGEVLDENTIAVMNDDLKCLKACLSQITTEISELKVELNNSTKIYLSVEEVTNMQNRKKEIEKLLHSAKLFDEARNVNSQLDACLLLPKSSLTEQEYKFLKQLNLTKVEIQDKINLIQTRLGEDLDDHLDNGGEDFSATLHELQYQLNQPDTYDCPNCSAKLELCSGKLELQLGNRSSKDDLRKQITLILDKIKQITIRNESRKEIKTLTSYLTIWDKMDHTLKEEEQLQENDKRVIYLKQRKEQFPKDITVLSEEELDKINKELQNIICSLSMYTIIACRSEQEIKEEINLKEELYNSTREKAKGILSQLKTNVMLKKIDEIEKRITQVKSLASQQNQQLVALNNIKIGLSSAVCEMINSHLNNLNLICNVILSRIFDEPIELMIKSFRQLADHRIKPQICIEINYRGTVFSGFNSLSGGEKSRISIALLIAFAKLQNVSGLIFMDEVISSLNSDKKEEVVEVIREQLEGFSVIMINHDTTEGIYDNIKHV